VYRVPVGLVAMRGEPPAANCALFAVRQAVRP
jgi:hypothetical protein